MSKYIPLSVPSLKGNEFQYVKECIDTEWVSSAGKYVDLFEDKIAEYTGSKYAIACVNGTSALQISLKLLELKKNEEVIVPTLTFIAPINCIRYNNLKPIFMDCDQSLNLDERKTINFINTNTTYVYDKKTNRKITINNRTKKRIGALIIVHTFGNASKFDRLYNICKKRNIQIIEDAAESLGTSFVSGKFKNYFTGTIGDIGCLSFNGNKIITSGGGGMIITNNDSMAKKARYLINQAKDDSLKYIHNEIGYNFRLSNLQAAIGYAQMFKLKSFIKKKKKIHEYYKAKFKLSKKISILDIPKYCSSNYWLNVISLNRKYTNINRDSVIDILNNYGIQTRAIWFSNHLQKKYKNYENYKIVFAKQYIDNSICLPSSYSLSKKNIDYIADIVLKIIE